MPYAAFSGPIPSVNLTMIAYPGTLPYRAGKRTAQRYTYSHAFPVLNYNATQAAFFGGNFWDSRATGYKLQAPDAEQAQGPPVDPLEMGFPDIACIAFRISSASYLPLFETVWGDSFNINWPSNTASICATPNGAAVFNGSATPILFLLYLQMIAPRPPIFTITGDNPSPSSKVPRMSVPSPRNSMPILQANTP